MPRALIFDCDGTLLDSMPAHYQAWCEALAEWGLEFPEERFYELAGVPTPRIVRLLADEQQREVDIARVTQVKEAVFLRDLARVEPIPAVVQIVREQYGRCPLAVASGGLRDVILRQLDQIGILGMFDTVVTAEDTVLHKPHPDVFLEAARRLAIPPADCCVYEDADLGIEAARRAGMTWIDIRCWHTPRRITPPASPG